MKLTDLLTEADFAKSLAKGDAKANEQLVKQLATAWRHDSTIPKPLLVKVGKPSLKKSGDELRVRTEIVNALSSGLDKALTTSGYGDLAAPGKFDAWLMRLYAGGIIDYEELVGEASEALGVWQLLSTRGLLRKEEQDFNRFKSLTQLQNAMKAPEYKNHVDRIKNEAVLEKYKRDAKEIILIDNAQLLVKTPLNYGACYVFNFGPGHLGGFCTGTSNVVTASDYFKQYSRDGIIIQVYDKTSKDTDVNGKWQWCAPRNQIMNADQQCHDCDQMFATRFPGLMTEIAGVLRHKAAEIKEKSAEFKLKTGGYDVETEIARFKSAFPVSFASEVPKPPEAPKVKKKKVKAARPA